MKKIFFILFLFLSIHGFSQISKDSTVWTWNGKVVSEKEWKDSSYAWVMWYVNNKQIQERQKQVADSIDKLYSTRKYQRIFKRQLKK